MENKFNETINGMLKELDGFVTSKSVVGDPISVGETVIIPLIDLKFGIGAGAYAKEKGDRAGGGIGAVVNPCAVLVIQNGMTKIVNVKNQDLPTKIFDMVPDIVNKFTAGRTHEDPEVKETVDNVLKASEQEKKNRRKE